MKHLLRTLTIGLVMGLTACISGGSLSTPDLVKHTGSASVALVYYDEMNDDDKVSDIAVYCSGVWVDETHILTAHHCVKVAQEEQQRKQDTREANQEPCEGFAALLGMCDPEAKSEHKVIALKGAPVHYVLQQEARGVGKEPDAWHLGHVAGWDVSHDVALITISGVVPPHEVAEVAEKVPANGEPVMVVGHPKGFYWTYLTGTVAGYRGSIPHDKTSGPFLQLQVPAYYGNSGGGAFDSSGKLIGMADQLVGLPGEALFVPVETLRSFLQMQGILGDK